MLYLLKKEDFNCALKHSPKLTVIGLVVFLLSIFLFFVYTFIAIENYNNYKIRLLDICCIVILSFFSILLIPLFYKIQTPKKMKKITNNENSSYEEQVKLMPYACLYYMLVLNLLILVLIY
ncbi:MAG: hypothetical protein OXJ52_01515 [Oligoflexia bacterium]|nr:hypothetical protein [Oligoflexia bacterium]